MLLIQIILVAKLPEYMALDKVLNKIQLQIDDLTPVLELFVDASIQPSVEDCEKLQKQLTLIQEHLAVYKHHKSNKELSPSYNLHVKVSEKESQSDFLKTAQEINQSVSPETKITVQEPKYEDAAETHSNSIKTVLPISVGINDKFRFINELFAQNSSEYNVAIEQLANLSNWPDTETYMSSLKSLYAWKEHTEVVKHFYAIVKKRFD